MPIYTRISRSPLKYCVFHYVLLSLPGLEREETVCDRPLAQHGIKEEEHGSSLSDVTFTLRLPSWSQALFSARRSPTFKHCHFLHGSTSLNYINTVRKQLFTHKHFRIRYSINNTQTLRITIS